MLYRGLAMAAFIGVSYYSGYKLGHNFTESQTEMASLSIVEIKSAAKTDTIFDSVFYYKATNYGDKYDINAFKVNEIFRNDQAGYLKAADLYKASFGGNVNGLPAAKSYNDSLALARNHGSSLSLSQKLAYLSFMGSRLSEGYSSETKNEHDMQKVFANAIAKQKDGGICGDIHRYLSDHAKALGFQDVGMHTGIWQKDKKGKNGGGHMVYHFRDPHSGVYFIQNYSQLVNTGVKTVQEAVDVSTRILGPISGVSHVESSTKVNKYHAYLPKTSRWVQDNLKGFAEIKENDPIVKLKVSNEGTTAGLQFTKDFGGTQARGFIMHSDFDTSDGRFEMNAVGVAMQNQVSKEVVNSIIDEYGSMNNFYAGFMQVKAPSFDAYMNSETKTRHTVVSGTKAKGYARINKTTGRIEVETFINDLGIDDRSTSIDVRPRVGVNQKINEKGLSVDGEREFEVTRNSQKSRSTVLETHYDRISVIYDTTQSSSAKAFLVINSEYYIFEGVEAYAASAVRQLVKASFPAAQFGTISFAVDASQIVSNRSKDAYYDNALAVSFRLGIEKAVNKYVTVGAGVEYNKNRPYWALDSDKTPEINKVKGFGGVIWISAKI